MNKPLRSLILIVLAIAIVGAGAYALYTKKALSPTGPAPAAVSGKQYMDAERGFSFQYPTFYELFEREAGTAERERHTITLIRESDTVPVEGGEGPTAISIDIIQNDIDKQSIMDWMTNRTEESNFNLGDGNYTSTTVGGADALVYNWSGLYEGKTTVFAHGDDIIAVSVTWLTPTDGMLADYDRLLKSFAFDPKG
ncbi:MAG: hypothetical protein V4681_02230 [Patescibacteria group bacterium]